MTTFAKTPLKQDILTRHRAVQDEIVKGKAELEKIRETANFVKDSASNKELKKIDKDVLRISGSSPELELLEVEKIKSED